MTCVVSISVLTLHCTLYIQGQVPLVVVATAGTTVLGTFDPFPEIADVCKRHSVWLHIDVRHWPCCVSHAHVTVT